jgi:hypothetical protein
LRYCLIWQILRFFCIECHEHRECESTVSAWHVAGWHAFNLVFATTVWSQKVRRQPESFSHSLPEGKVHTAASKLNKKQRITATTQWSQPRD